MKGVDVAAAIILDSVRNLAAERDSSHFTQSECIEYIGMYYCFILVFHIGFMILTFCIGPLYHN